MNDKPTTTLLLLATGFVVIVYLLAIPISYAKNNYSAATLAGGCFGA